MSGTCEELVATGLETFLRKTFPTTHRLTLHHSLDLFDHGIIDSIGIVELVAHLESSFAVTISDDVLLSADFGTIAGMARHVAALIAGREGADGS